MTIPLFWSRLIPFWRSAEILAARYLRRIGFRVVASSFRIREGEVDLIAWEGPVLVFVEVKSRRSLDSPEASVGYRKRQRIIRAARAYIARHRLYDVTYRFDIVAINDVTPSKPTYRLLRDAFRPAP
jgi:putative endonuclease